MTPTQTLIKAMRKERYNGVHVAEWVEEITGSRPAQSTVSHWSTGKSEPDPAVLKALHERFQKEGHDAVGGLV